MWMQIETKHRGKGTREDGVIEAKFKKGERK
jgi:hypothetical protein